MTSNNDPLGHQQTIQTSQRKKTSPSSSGFEMAKAKLIPDPDPPWICTTSHFLARFKLVLITAWSIMAWIGLFFTASNVNPLERAQTLSIDHKQCPHTRAQSPSPSNYDGSRNRPQTGAKHGRQYHQQDSTGFPDWKEVIRGVYLIDHCPSRNARTRQSSGGRPSATVTLADISAQEAL